MKTNICLFCKGEMIGFHICPSFVRNMPVHRQGGMEMFTRETTARPVGVPLPTPATQPGQAEAKP